MWIKTEYTFVNRRDLYMANRGNDRKACSMMNPYYVTRYSVCFELVVTSNWS